MNPRGRQSDDLCNRSYSGAGFIGFLDGAVSVFAGSNVSLEFLDQALLLFEPGSFPTPYSIGYLLLSRYLTWKDFALETIGGALLVQTKGPAEAGPLGLKT